MAVGTCVVGQGQLAASDGPYSVTVSYSGANRFLPSDGTASIVVGRGVSTTTVIQPSVSSVQGQAVVFGATVTPGFPSPSALGGTVGFVVKDANGVVVACDGGGDLRADRTQSCRVAGVDLTAARSPYQVTATWSGDGDFAGSTRTAVHKVTVH